MDGEVKIKNVVFYLFVIILISILTETFFKFSEKVNFDFVNKFTDKIRHTQSIAPERLFVNVWRIARIEFVDSTMNNQDWYRWRARYVRKIKTIDDANVAINSMLSSLNDPYTKFLQSKSFSEQKVILDSKITGVGVVFNKSGDDVVVNHILKNSSAQTQNILPGDSIISINNIDVKNVSLEELHSYIENAKDKNIQITIKRGDKIVVKNLEKKEIHIDTMDYQITKDNIGIITLSNVMGEKAILDFRNILSKTNSTKGIIIDLRNNYGGILANAVIMADLMLSEDKKIVSIDSRGVSKFRIYADDESVFKQKPIIILVNRKTASAAEILAGALKDSAGAILIGENTYGKNSIQQVIPMSNSTGLIISSAKYILPNGEDINGRGIEPSIFYSSDDMLKEAEKLINEIVKKE